MDQFTPYEKATAARDELEQELVRFYGDDETRKKLEKSLKYYQKRVEDLSIVR